MRSRISKRSVDRNRNIAFASQVAGAPPVSALSSSLERLLAADHAHLAKARSALGVDRNGFSTLVSSLRLFEPGHTIYDRAMADLLSHIPTSRASEIASVPFAYMATCEPNGVAMQSDTGERCILLDIRFDCFFNRLTPYLLCAFGTRPPVVADPLWMLPSVHVVYVDSFWREPAIESFFSLDVSDNLFRFCSQIQDGVTLSIVAHELAHFALGHLNRKGPVPPRGQHKQEFAADAEGCRVLLEYFRQRGQGDIAQFVNFCYLVFFSGLYLFEMIEGVADHPTHPAARDRIAAIREQLGRSEGAALPFGFLDASAEFIRRFADADVLEMTAVAKRTLRTNGIGILD